MVGSSLAAAAGLNAWIPLLAVGVLARFTDLITLPSAWSWLTSDIALWIIAALLVVEVVADKVPALDSINDIVHTAIRPAAGGIAFGAGSAAETLRLDGVDATTINWGPIITGIVIALVVHAIKAAARPVANAATAGIAAPALSTAEDVVSVSVSLLAILVPVLAVILVIVVVIVGIAMIVRGRRRRAERRARTA